MLGFSFSLLCRGGSDTSAMTGWTDGKPWKMAWGELRWEDGSDDRVDGRKTVGNNSGRAPFGGRAQGSPYTEELLHREVLLTQR